MSEQSDDKGFINRWSSRKRRAELQEAMQSGPPLPTESLPTEHSSDTQIAEESVAIDTPEKGSRVQSGSKDEEPLLSDADMPPIDTLSADSDVSAFFNKGVSAALRKAALRHVFRQPAYNVRDGLNDYDGDYTVFEPLGDTVTSDMKWHIARKERDRLEAEARELEQRRLEAGREHDYDEQDVQEPAEEPAEEQAEEPVADKGEHETQAEPVSQEVQEVQEIQEIQEAQEIQEIQEIQEAQEAQQDVPEEQAGQSVHAQQKRLGTDPEQAGFENKVKERNMST